MSKTVVVSWCASDTVSSQKRRPNSLRITLPLTLLQSRPKMWLEKSFKVVIIRCQQMRSRFSRPKIQFSPNLLLKKLRSKRLALKGSSHANQLNSKKLSQGFGICLRHTQGRLKAAKSITPRARPSHLSPSKYFSTSDLHHKRSNVNSSLHPWLPKPSYWSIVEARARCI